MLVSSGHFKEYMKILIAGASGFIGSALVDALMVNSHQITVVGRSLSRLKKMFPTSVQVADWQGLAALDANHFDAVINLSGSNIAEKRWSVAVKKELIHSRVKSNEKLIQWILDRGAKPHYLCANAVGIYGLQNPKDSTSYDEDTIIDVDCPADFLSEIGVAWQQSLQPVIDQGLRVTVMRFGVVLKRGFGMMKKLELSFYTGLGAVVGSGEQTISWIHIDDVTGTILFLLDHPSIKGAVNITSPYPVSQKDFANVFAKVLRRPRVFKIPALVIKFLFGEMGESLLLKGQRVIPKRLQEEGYYFHYPQLTEALENLYRKI